MTTSAATTVTARLDTRDRAAPDFEAFPPEDELVDEVVAEEELADVEDPTADAEDGDE